MMWVLHRFTAGCLWFASALFCIDSVSLLAQNVSSKEIANVATEPREKVRETYRKDYAAARSNSEKESLARKLIAIANRTTKDPVKRSALLDEALDLGVEAGSPKIAMAIAENKHPAESELIFKEKQNVLERLIEGGLNDSSRLLVNSHLYCLILDAIDAEQYGTARELVGLYDQLSDKYPSNMIAERDDRAQAFLAQIDDLVKLHAEFLEASTVLKSKRNDPAANRTVGLYLSFARHDWSRGLEHLLRGKDEVANAVEQEQKMTMDPTALIALGDRWMDVAGKVPRAYRPEVWSRAGNFYSQARRKASEQQQEHIARQRQVIIDGSREILVRVTPPDETGAPLVNRPADGTQTALAMLTATPTAPSEASQTIPPQSPRSPKTNSPLESPPSKPATPSGGSPSKTPSTQETRPAKTISTPEPKPAKTTPPAEARPSKPTAVAESRPTKTTEPSESRPSKPTTPTPSGTSPKTPSPETRTPATSKPAPPPEPRPDSPMPVQPPPHSPPPSRPQPATYSSDNEAPDPVPEFSIVAAHFGNAAGGTDLTERLQKAAKDGLLLVFVEPILGADRKHGELFLSLKTKQEKNTKTNNLKYTHRQFVFLDSRPLPMIPKQGLVILDAYYGTGIWREKQMVDAKKLLLKHIKENQIDIPVKELVSSIPDPASGQSKVLIVRYALDGMIQKMLFQEHETVKLGPE